MGVRVCISFLFCKLRMKLLCLASFDMFAITFFFFLRGKRLMSHGEGEGGEGQIKKEDMKMYQKTTITSCHWETGVILNVLRWLAWLWFVPLRS